MRRRKRRPVVGRVQFTKALCQVVKSYGLELGQDEVWSLFKDLMLVPVSVCVASGCSVTLYGVGRYWIGRASGRIKARASMARGIEDALNDFPSLSVKAEGSSQFSLQRFGQVLEVFRRYASSDSSIAGDVYCSLSGSGDGGL